MDTIEALKDRIFEAFYHFFIRQYRNPLFNLIFHQLYNKNAYKPKASIYLQQKGLVHVQHS